LTTRYIPVQAKRDVLMIYRRFRANYPDYVAMRAVRDGCSLQLAAELAGVGKVDYELLDRYRAASFYLRRMERARRLDAHRRQASAIKRRQGKFWLRLFAA
jgi:hypothetical protein